MPFKPGQSGNPKGRPKGARNRIGTQFLEALEADFNKFGSQAIAQVSGRWCYPTKRQLLWVRMVFLPTFDGGPMCPSQGAVSWRWNLSSRVWLEDFKEHKAKRRSAD